MKEISFKEFGPTITNDKVAMDLYNKVLECNPSVNQVKINLDGICTMTTKCAKIIFGTLYRELNSMVYYQNIVLENCSDTLSMIIDMAIDDATRENS